MHPTPKGLAQSEQPDFSSASILLFIEEQETPPLVDHRESIDGIWQSHDEITKQR